MNTLRVISRKEIIHILKTSIKSNAPYRSLVSVCNHKLITPLISYKLPVLNDFQIREYAKGRDKPKSASSKKVEIRDDILAEAINPDKYREALQDVVDTLKEQYIQRVSLRSSVGSIESITIEYEGDEYTIQDLAQINRKNPKLIALSFASFPQTIPAVMEAINKSGLNVSPQQDGTSVYIPIPKVTREHRENLVKNSKALLNKCKENIRVVQGTFLRKLDRKESEGLAKDKALSIKEQIMKLASTYIAEAEKMQSDKEKDLLQEKDN